MSSVVTKFFEGTATNQSGLSWFDVLAMDNDQLEHSHDWVQWMFPLPEPSLAVPDSPVLEPGDILKITRNIELKSAYWIGVNRMCDFYVSTKYWLKYTDHNHKRITRIIRSMKLILGREDAMLFYDMIMKLNADAGTPVSTLNSAYWHTELFP